VGHRMDLKHTRRMITAALNGELDDVPTREDDAFGLQIPERVPEVPDEVLRPRQTWEDPEAYDAQAEKLINMFRESFRKFADSVPEGCATPGPDRDPGRVQRHVVIREPVWGTITVDPTARRIVDSAAFQRLRYIRQLGLAHLVYPGASHTRFDHALGVYHLITRALGSMERRGELAELPGAETAPGGTGGAAARRGALPVLPRPGRAR
jgi:hypothetical protein